ncbi:MAG: hypothetical protein COA78_07625 [Blastopirellula sp.]|nr:MAG: hypothetical protein COA78_07625 [Blastopirellula sp.]
MLLLLFVLVFSHSTFADESTSSACYRGCETGYPCPNYSCTPRAGDQVYLINTRCLPGGCGNTLPVDQMTVSRFEAGTGWVDSSVDQLLSTDSPSGVTSFYVHGNRMNEDWAHRRGWAMYHELTRGLPAERNVRFIIWSWPTAPGGGVIQGTRDNATRADDDAYYLGSLINQMPGNEKISLSGFSFGARVISGALHLLGGGSLHARSFDQIAEKENQYRVVFFAAATSSHWLSPDQYHSQAMSQVDRLLNLYNSADPMLKRYKVVNQDPNDQALGYTGFAYKLAEGEWEKVTQINACSTIGKDHDWNKFACAGYFMNQARAHLLWDAIE